MTDTFIIGLARMHLEYGERRDFLPSFVAILEKQGAQVFLEYGYGSGLGYTEDDYKQIAPSINFLSHEEIFQLPNVLVLRCPSDAELDLLKPGTCLISMLHYPTRPQRVARLKALGIEAISLDLLTDETGRRIVENLRAVAWNGLQVGFNVLHRTFPAPGLESTERSPIQALIIGIGAVGMHAVQAASRYGDNRLWQVLATRGVPGVQVTAVDYDLTGREEGMKDALKQTDILVDATHRPEPSQIVIPNEWILMIALLIRLS